MPDRLSCPHCAYTAMTAGAVGAHMRRVHDVWGGLSGQRHPARRKTARKKKPAQASLALAPPEAPQPAPVALNGDQRITFTVLPCIVLEDARGGRWLAQRIPDA